MLKRKTRNQDPKYNDSDDYDTNKQLKTGHLYIIYNKNSKYIYKIGITRNDNNQLLSRYSVYYTEPYCMQFDKDVCNYDKAEHLIHNILQPFRINNSELFENINFHIVKLVVDSVVYIFNKHPDLITDFKIKMSSKCKQIKMNIDLDSTEDKDFIQSIKIDTEQKLPPVLCDIILQHICEQSNLQYEVVHNLLITDAIVKINNMYNDAKIIKLKEIIPNFDNKLENLKQLKIKYESELKSYQQVLSNSGEEFHPNDIEPTVLSDLLLY